VIEEKQKGNPLSQNLVLSSIVCLAAHKRGEMQNSSKDLASHDEIQNRYCLS
jgi:hypothetical protein